MVCSPLIKSLIYHFAICVTSFREHFFCLLVDIIRPFNMPGSNRAV